MKIEDYELEKNQEKQKDRGGGGDKAKRRPEGDKEVGSKGEYNLIELRFQFFFLFSE